MLTKTPLHLFGAFDTHLFALAAFLVYIALLILAITFTLARVYRYRNAGLNLPRLILRDITLLSGHATSIALTLVTSGTNNPPRQPVEPIIIALESLPAIFGLAVYVYFEVFVIERGT